MMDEVISFLLIVLLIWEFLAWRRMTKYRKDMIRLRSAMGRYLYRRNELLEKMRQNAVSHHLPFADFPKSPLNIPQEGLTLEELQQQLVKNRGLDKVLQNVLSTELWLAAMEADEDLYYAADEFRELQEVLLKCISAYNQTYDAFNRSVQNMPTAIVAKMLRIRAMTSGHLIP